MYLSVTHCSWESLSVVDLPKVGAEFAFFPTLANSIVAPID
ncbi:hypothetical protein RMSM_03999 [Rhodopirellula maiorica SM1]|uniref:Uncharacterized protein n=1 Tax=Rhodopirellula maiorica SM1 TaxID=1265738 RepID=M5RUL1_9BACT|nr:hypothetical protein RMSM_03999 [Rhodopirellula maiorica SM1]